MEMIRLEPPAELSMSVAEAMQDHALGSLGHPPALVAAARVTG